MPIYDLDLSGVNPSNRITNENHTFATPESRIFTPDGSPFFTDGLQIRRQPENTLLQPYTHYKALWLEKDATMATGKDVCAVIWITDPTVNEVNLTYQAIGGPYTNNVAAIQAAIASLSLPDSNEVAWGRIIDQPVQYPPVEHLHHIRTVYGFQELISMLEALRIAIVNRGESGVISAIYQYIDNRIQNDTASMADISSTIQAITAAIGLHVSSGHTPAQVGLSNLHNYPKATIGEGLTGAADDRYATVLTASKAALGVMRSVGLVTDQDPNAVITPLTVSRHTNCPTGATGVTAFHRFLILTSFFAVTAATENVATPNRYQVAIATNGVAGIWVREYSAPTWSAWTRIDNANATDLSTTDLDTIKTAGEFWQLNDANATAPRHYPRSGVKCTMTVTVGGAGGAQAIQRMMSLEQTIPTEHIRRWDGTTWSAWQSVLDRPFSITLLATDNLNNISEHGWYNMQTGNASTSLNYPLGAGDGSLFVLDHRPQTTGAHGGLTQWYYNLGNFSVWERRTTGTNAWGPWVIRDRTFIEPYQDHPIPQAIRRANATMPQGGSYNGSSVRRMYPELFVSMGASQQCPGLLGVDGKVYSVEMANLLDSISMSAYDPLTNAVQQNIIDVPVPNVGTTQQMGAMVPSTAGDIFIVPLYLNITSIEPGKFYRYNIHNDQMFTYNTPAVAGEYGWATGSITAYSDFAYCPPWTGKKVAKINNIEPDMVFMAANSASTATDCHYGSIQLGLDGKLYCIPFNSEFVMIIDPVTDTFEEINFGLSLTDQEKWLGSFLGSDGKIYGVPYDAQDFLIIDPSTKTAIRSPLNIAASLTGTAKFAGACPGPDGRFYCPPANPTQAGVLIVNTDSYISPASCVVGLTGIVPAGADRYNGLTQTPAGTLYSPALTTSKFLTIEHHKAQPLGLDILLSPFYNKTL